MCTTFFYILEIKMAKITSLAKHLTLQKDLGPERDYTERGRLRKVFSTFGANMKNMFVINLFLDIFALPFIVIFIFLMAQYEQSQLTAAGFSFSGFLGIGYGLTDDTVAGINLIYGIRQKCFLYFFTPSLMIFSIGAAGAYHCIRNAYWGVEVKVVKHFFRGIKLHWWKFLIAFTFMGLVGTNAAWSTIELIRLMSTTGSASAGIWVWSIASLLFALLTMLYMGTYLPMAVCFKFKYKDNIKNALINTLIMFVLGLIVTLMLIAPMFLMLAGFLKYILYLFMITMGACLYIMINIGFGNFGNDMLINAMYVYEQEQAAKLAADEKKRQTRENKNRQPSQKGKKGKKR